MKFVVLAFLAIAAAVFGFREVLTKRERRVVLKGTRAWVVPVLIAAAVVIALLFFSLNNFNGKVI